MEEEKMNELLEDIRAELRRLGLNGAATSMGAMEVISLEIKNGLAEIAAAIRELNIGGGK